MKFILDLIEWFDDDVGQYQDKFPRNLELELDTSNLTSEDDIGNRILDILKTKYGVEPVLVSWNPETAVGVGC